MDASCSSVSCGVCEVFNLTDGTRRRTGRKLLEEFLREYEYEDSRRTVILFSDNFRRGAKGELIAKELAKHPRLGRLITTDKIVNRNTGHTIQVWMFITSEEYGRALRDCEGERYGSSEREDGYYWSRDRVDLDTFKQFLTEEQTNA